MEAIRSTSARCRRPDERVQPKMPEAALAVLLVRIPAPPHWNRIPARGVPSGCHFPRDLDSTLADRAFVPVTHDVDLVAGLLERIDLETHALPAHASRKDRITGSGIVVDLPCEVLVSLDELQGDILRGRSAALRESSDPRPGQVAADQ